LTTGHTGQSVRPSVRTARRPLPGRDTQPSPTPIRSSRRRRKEKEKKQRKTPSCAGAGAQAAPVPAVPVTVSWRSRGVKPAAEPPAPAHRLPHARIKQTKKGIASDRSDRQIPQPANQAWWSQSRVRDLQTFMCVSQYVCT
jgi:hypothetical protein